MKLSALALSLVFAVVVGACVSTKAAPTGATSASVTAPVSPVSDEERAAYEKARPVFDAYCMKCHTAEGAKTSGKAVHHIDMDTYPFGGHHASEAGGAVREALTGKEPSMPKDNPGSLKPEELALVLAWADAFDRAHPPSQHEHDDDHHHGEHHDHDDRDDHHDDDHDDDHDGHH